MAVYDNSRYMGTSIYKREEADAVVFNLRERSSFNAENYTLYEWVEGDTLDGVAYNQYGVSALRWAILDANPKYRTEWDINNGDVINIPDYEEVVSLVNVDEDDEE